MPFLTFGVSSLRNELQQTVAPDRTESLGKARSSNGHNGHKCNLLLYACLTTTGSDTCMNYICNCPQVREGGDISVGDGKVGPFELYQVLDAIQSTWRSLSRSLSRTHELICSELEIFLVAHGTQDLPSQLRFRIPVEDDQKLWIRGLSCRGCT